MKETNHDYAGALTGNYFSNDCNGSFDSWHEFKSTWAGFIEQYDDAYNFLFRFDLTLPTAKAGGFLGDETSVCFQ